MGQFDWTPDDLPGADPLRDPALRRAAGAGRGGDPVPARARARAGDGDRGDDPAPDRGPPRRLGDRPRRQPRHGLPRPPELRRRPARPHGGPAARRPLGPGHLGPLGQPARRRAAAEPLPPGQGPVPLPGHRRRLRAASQLERPGRVVRGRDHLAGRGDLAGQSRATRTERSAARLARYHPATDGRPEEENFQRAPRQAARQPQGRQGAAQQLPALPQPAPAASGLPDLRHLRRA